MSMQSVYDFLSLNKGKQFTIQDLADELDTSANSIGRNLTGLRKIGEVEVKIKKKAFEIKTITLKKFTVRKRVNYYSIKKN